MVQNSWNGTSPVLCYVTDHASLPPGGDLRRTILGAIAAGVDWIQIREKDCSARDLLALAQEALAASSGTGTRILVNDRLDVAVAAVAAGVHLGENSLPVADVVEWCRAGKAPTNFLVGASCHSPAGAQQAERDGASYAVFGPVFETPSKAPYGPPQGVVRLEELCRSIELPVLAIGGIHAQNAAACLRAGARGIAAIRMFQAAADLPELVRQLRAMPPRAP